MEPRERHDVVYTAKALWSVDRTLRRPATRVGKPTPHAPSPLLLYCTTLAHSFHLDLVLVRMMSRPDLHQGFPGEPQSYGTGMQQTTHQVYQQHQLPLSPNDLYYYYKNVQKRHEADLRRLVQEALAPWGEQWARELGAKNETFSQELKRTRDYMISGLRSAVEGLDGRQKSLAEQLSSVCGESKATKGEQQHARLHLQSMADDIQQIMANQQSLVRDISERIESHQKKTEMQFGLVLSSIQSAAAQDKMRPVTSGDMNKAMLCDISAQLEQVLQLLRPGNTGTKRKTRSHSRNSMENDLQSMPPILRVAAEAMMKAKEELCAVAQAKAVESLKVKRENSNKRPSRKRSRRN